jgi:asparagine synthetase B (glutamine-hydrolysing)
MCGILGIAATNGREHDARHLAQELGRLFLLSETRGKEAAGLAIARGDRIYLYKAAVPASLMLSSGPYASFLGESLFQRETQGIPPSIAVIGHSRLQTDGAADCPFNNQPIMGDRIVGVHNGIIVNHEDLWRQNPDLERRGTVDSEVIFALLRRELDAHGDLQHATQQVFGMLKGMASIAAIFADLNVILLASNNGSLYYHSEPNKGAFYFGSEARILRAFARSRKASGQLPQTENLRPRTALILDLEDARVIDFPLTGTDSISPHLTTPRIPPRRIVWKEQPKTPSPANPSLAPPIIHQSQEIEARFSRAATWQDALRRCQKCILPETMPFITFDASGTCNYCLHYRRIRTLGVAELRARISQAPSPSSPDSPHCVVGLSGGRDSTFALHYIKRILGLKAVAYTYDWGMVTDLARRNISRICGELGIEHILVSADIARKRRHIRQNVIAWLKRPDLGMIPLFMAGDKQYFFHLQRVRRELQAPLAFQGENLLERTDFKTGFAGVRPYTDDPWHSSTLSSLGTMQVGMYYALHFLLNPRYINASLLDTISAYASYFLLPKNYFNLYSFLPWSEDDIIGTLTREYDFELAPDTRTTWRIGDGTAPFYNYIYHTVAGFSEHDTFRSNQIREGQIDRETALRKAQEENHPRFEAILWYLNAINLGDEADRILRIIHSIPKVAAPGRTSPR